MEIGKRDLRVVVPAYGVESVLTIPSTCVMHRFVDGPKHAGQGAGQQELVPIDTHAAHPANCTVIVSFRLSNKALKAAGEEQRRPPGELKRLVEVMRIKVFQNVEVDLSAVVAASPQVLYCTLVLPAAAPRAPKPATIAPPS